VVSLVLLALLSACDPTSYPNDPTPVADKRPQHGTTTTTSTTVPAATSTTVPATTTSTTVPATTTTSTTVPAGGGTTLFADTFNGLLAGTPWLDDAIVGGWTSVYNGYGLNDVEVDGTNVLAESPQISTSAGQTHAGLVVTTNSFGDFDATVRMKTVQQLRTGSAPNPWEVGWLLWHHTDDTHFYYFVPKPNGWELGKEDPAYPGAQRYLATAPTPTFPVGAWYTVRIREVGSTMTVWVNGTQIASFTDSQRPYASGHLGLYNEDAHVRFDDVTVKAP